MKDAEKSFKVSRSLIQSMTAEERSKPELLAASASRRRRIARGAGRTDAEVVTLIEVFAGMRSKMQDVGRMMRITGGKVNQMSAEEMTSLVGAKKRVTAGKVRRYKEPQLRKLATADESAFAEAWEAAAAAAAAQARPAAPSKKQ